MTFRTRNLYYLRINSIVLPLYVFLDELHTSWMTDFILQRVLVDLRPHILSQPTPTGAKTGKPAICTLEGDGYQLCYFFRNVDDQSVLVKRRFYTAEPAPTMTQGGKRKRKPAHEDVPRNVEQPRRSKRTRKRKQSRNSDVDDFTTEEPTSITEPTRSEHSNSGETGSPDGSAMAETVDEDAMVLDDEVLDVDIGEEKPKPRMQLRYEGFHIHGQCLCVVVEPLPQNAGEKELSTTITDPTPERNREPLFLPEKDNDLEDDQSSETEEIGMVAFSQRLSAMGDYSTVMVDDDEGGGEEVLGDADDSREY